MKDIDIIELYWTRNENAISETSAKYGKYCFKIAYNILNDIPQSEECFNDTYLKLWNSIPPQRPSKFSAFLGRITRNLALDTYKSKARAKRGFGETALILDELIGCIPSNSDTEKVTDSMVITDVLNRFLSSLPSESRIIFIQRYWHMSSIKEIANNFNCSESKIKMSLFRSRNELKALLEKEGIII